MYISNVFIFFYVSFIMLYMCSCIISHKFVLKQFSIYFLSYTDESCAYMHPGNKVSALRTTLKHFVPSEHYRIEQHIQLIRHRNRAYSDMVQFVVVDIQMLSFKLSQISFLFQIYSSENEGATGPNNHLPLPVWVWWWFILMTTVRWTGIFYELAKYCSVFYCSVQAKILSGEKGTLDLNVGLFKMPLSKNSTW